MVPLRHMSNDSQISSVGDKTIIAPCRGCGVEIPTRGAIGQVDDDGNVISKIAFDLCADCKAKLQIRMEESKVLEAEAKARYEKSLADLINSIPKKTEKQIGFDMGLD